MEEVDAEEINIELERLETADNATSNVGEHFEEKQAEEHKKEAEQLREQRREEKQQREEQRKQEEQQRQRRKEQAEQTEKQVEQSDSNDANSVHPSSTQSNRQAKEDTETKGMEEEPQATVNIQGNHYLMAQAVEAEAKDEPYSGKVGVAEVIRNRVNSTDFPNSIEGVIYQQGQFQVVSNGTIHNEPTQEAIQAVQEALNGSNRVQGATFFYNPEIATLRYQDTRETLEVIGNHYFS